MTALLLLAGIAGACNDVKLLDLGAEAPRVVRLSKSQPTVLVFRRPVRGVAVEDARFLAQEPQLQDGRVTLRARGEAAKTTATFEFDEGVRLGPFSLLLEETGDCEVRVHSPAWARLDSLMAELEQARGEARLLREKPAVATIGNALLVQPKDRPSMFRVETRRYASQSQGGEVRVDAVLAYWLFDVVYVVLRVDTSDSSWGFARVTAKSATVVGTFFDFEYRSEPRDLVVALRRQPKDRGPVTLTVHDVSGQRSISLPPLDLL